jgi:hypothetical protein
LEEGKGRILWEDHDALSSLGTEFYVCSPEDLAYLTPPFSLTLFSVPFF